MKRCRQLVLRRELGVTNGGVDFEVGRETRDGLVAEHARSAENQDAVAHGTRTASPVCADRSAASVAAIVSSGSGPSCAAPLRPPAQRRELRVVTLVAARLARALAAGSVQLERAEVVQRGGAAAGVGLDVFLPSDDAPSATYTIVARPRAREVEQDGEAASRGEWPPGLREHRRADLLRHGIGEPACEVDEVAALAEQAPPPPRDR